MLASTIVKNDSINNSLVFNEHTSTYKFLNTYNHFLFSSGEFEDNDLELLDLTSDTKKIFMSSNIGPFHILFENIFPIINMQRSNIDVEIIIDTFEINARNSISFIPYIEKLQNNNIKISFINSSGYGGIIINNYHIFSAYNNQQPINREMLSQNTMSLVDYSKDPYKRIYVSRRKFVDTSPVRISDELELESFFTDNGFEVIFPEDFLTIDDEVLFFSKVKTLVSLSSSAIAWAVFMKPGGNVIELQTDFPAMPGVRTIHHQYNAICYAKEHNYFAIANYDRFSDKLIKRIKDSRILTIV